MKQAAKLLGLMLVVQALNFLVVLRFFWASFTNQARAWDILDAYDVVGNVAANDPIRQEISKRAALARNDGKRWGCVLCRFLDWFDQGHCDKQLT